MTSTNSHPTEEEELALAEELARRVVFSLMTPASRLSATRELPLKELTNYLRLAYFRQLRNKGKTLREIGDSLDISVRTAKRLSQQLKENFFAPEREHELPRRIEFMLWATPMTRARINQVLEDVSGQECEDAIDQLLDEERVREVEGRVGYYEACRPQGSRIVRDTMIARVGALNAFLNNATNAIHHRFFAQKDKAFVRTLSFRIRPEDLAELREIYESSVWERLSALEQRVEERDDALEMQLSVCWAPYDMDDNS